MDDRDAYIGNPDYGVIVPFLRRERPDWDGRWLTDIRAWDHLQLERDHHYIQWLFPLTRESEAVFAPRLRDFEVEILRGDPLLRAELLDSFRQILNFWGFALAEGGGVSVSPSRDFAERRIVWMSRENHNYLRVSRVLGSLNLLGFHAHASAFLAALEDVYDTPEGRASIDSLAIWFWRQRARPNR